MDFNLKDVLVCGVARSGVSAALLLKKSGAKVTIQDLKKDVKEAAFLKEKGINLILGENPSNEFIDKLDFVVVSPGVPLDLEFIEYAKNKMPVISEIELAYLNCQSKILGITGTNGKTTTTSLMGHILKYFANTHVVGNIGIPFSEKVQHMKKDDLVVAELSSFQLESIKTFRPKVSCILNITPDHLNRHKTMENYILAKENIFLNQTENDFLILNFDDSICRDISKKTKAKVMYFSLNSHVDNGAYLKDEYIFINCMGYFEKFININEIKILGSHNIQNVMASILMCLCVDVPLNLIKDGIKTFKAVEHRIEFVCTKNGVDYFNDSKATNTDASIKAVEAMKKPIYLIAGGYEKNADFTEFINVFRGRVKNLALVGEVKERFAKKCEELSFFDYNIFDSFEEALLFCYKNARQGECVLLSPACASWDMFKDFEERGNLFKQIVMQLKE